MEVGRVDEKKKHAGGRPRKYESPEQMQVKIDEYFESCFRDEFITTDKGLIIYDAAGMPRTQIIQFKPFTITGLCLGLDLDMDGLLKYEKEYNEFGGTVKKAKLRIEEDNQIGALTNKRNPIFTIFSLKNNFGWADKQEIEHSGKDGGPLNIVITQALPKEVYGSKE